MIYKSNIIQMQNFTNKQTDAYESFLNGNNIFITGPGGCGKSYFIKKIWEISKKEDKNIYVTSLTGCSAILLGCGATTIHKWGALGLGRGDEMSIYLKVSKKKQNLYNYLNADILVIDEISMLNQLMFETIDFLCRKIRNCDQPFGGIQIVASGDFYQLPPVGDNDDKSSQSRFCFQSTLWEKTFEKGNSFEFDVNFRQNDVPEYFKILQEIRTGTPSFDTIGVLVKCCKKKYTEDDKSKPTILYPTKTKVEEINKRELNKLLSQQSESREYKYHIKKDDNIIEKPKIESVKNQIDNLLKNGRFEETLKLCVGCQVMCISNINQEIGLVNGSQGIVKRFEFGYPVVKFDNIQTEMKIKEHSWGVESEDTPEENPHTINQLPLVLSWAITIHKSQGMSIENAIVDIGNSIFQYGQTYVALSRVKSLNGLYLTKMNAQKIKAHPEVKKFYKKLKSDDEEI